MTKLPCCKLSHGSASWSLHGGGELGLSTRHRRDGEQSLAWTWVSGGALDCGDIGLDLARHPGAGVKAWLYLEVPVDGALTFSFGTAAQLEAGRPAYRFRFGLDFTGWRACWVALAEDAAVAGGDASGAVEMMRIQPPVGMGQGTVFFDAVEYVDAVGLRSADYQVPFLPTGDDPYTTTQPLLHVHEQPRHPLPDAVTDRDRETIATLRERYTFWLLGTQSGRFDELPAAAAEETRAFIRQGWDGYRELGIQVREDGCLSGPALGLRRGKSTCFELFNVMLPLAFDFTLTESEKARDAALLLFDYVADQGWAEGSSRGHMFLNILVFAAYCHALYLMRDELERSGRLDAHLRAAWWYLCFGKAFRAFDTPEQETNTDEQRSIVFTALPVILAMSESPRQVQYLKSWRDWLQSALPICPKFAGMIKPDGTGWHHRGIYTVCYTGEAYELAAVAAYMLHDTPYALDAWARDNLAFALRTEFEMSFNREMPFALRGRMPRGGWDPESAGWYAMCAAFGFLAMASAEHRQTMGAIFSRLWEPSLPAHVEALRLQLFNHFPCKETVGRRVLLEAFAAEAPAPVEVSPSFQVKPWGALALARGTGFLAAIKGYGQYVWNFECHPKAWAAQEENVYARFVSNGHVQILADAGPGRPTTLGYNLAQGWDWARWPGATNKHLTLDELYSPTDTWQTRWLSDEAFVGGTAAGRDEGVFAVKLHDTCFDSSFRAVKSYFVFGNAIICLGSGIDCKDTEHAIETTLFQAYLPGAELPLHLDGEAITTLPYARELEPGRAHAVLDPYGNGYVVPAGQTVHLRRQHQVSRTHDNRGPTVGDYALAWIDHGRAPSNAGYAYAILVQTSSEALQRFVEAEPYRVLQCDAVAHVVDYPSRRLTAAAIFAVETELPHGPVLRTDTPITLTARAREDGGRELSLAVPDLRLPRRANFGFLTGDDVHVCTRPTIVSVLLRGRWTLDDRGQAQYSAVSKYNDDLSVLEVECRNGTTVSVNLKPCAGSCR